MKLFDVQDTPPVANLFNLRGQPKIMTPEEIKKVTCQCPKKNFDDSYRHSITKHILHRPCSKPFESLAKFTCALCGYPAVNKYFYEFNALRDYDSDGNLTTFIACKDCND